jgi:hypothetical protein
VAAAKADLFFVNGSNYIMEKQASVHDIVAATLNEMGVHLAPMWTALIKKGYFVGHKYRFDGGYAVWLIEKNVIEIYDDSGKLLKTVSLEETEKKDAA